MSDSQTPNKPLAVPEELKAIIQELKISETDPKIQSLVWVLNEFNQFKTDLQSSQASLKAVFDARLDTIKDLLKALDIIDQDLRQLSGEIKKLCVQLREKVEKELQVPYVGLVQSYTELDKKMKSLLELIERETTLIPLSFYTALLTSGFMGGAVAGICLCHLLGL